MTSISGHIIIVVAIRDDIVDDITRTDALKIQDDAVSFIIFFVGDVIIQLVVFKGTGAVEIIFDGGGSGAVKFDIDD